MRPYHSFLRILVLFCIPAGSRPVEETTTLDTRTASSETTPDIALPDALIAINDTVSRVSAANGQGTIPDGTTLDDLQRLLDIIAGHVERMREATQGGNNGANANSNANTGKAPTKFHNKANDNNKPHPMAIPQGAVIVNHDSMNEDNDPPQGELQVTSDEHGFTNITCKGISVCNPVTVISGKDGKKIRLDKLDKNDRKKNKKKFKGWGKDKAKDF